MLKRFIKLNTIFLLVAFLISVVSAQSVEAQTKQQQQAKKEQQKAYNQGPDQRQLYNQKANSGQGTSSRNTQVLINRPEGTPYKPVPGVNQQQQKSPYTVGNQQLNNDARVKNSIKENLKSPPKQIIPPKNNPPSKYRR